MSDFWDDKTLLDAFWGDSDYFTGPPLTKTMLREAERRLGYKLPASYVKLLGVRNGGSPRAPYFHFEGLQGWTGGYLLVKRLRGVSHEYWRIKTGDGDDYPNFGLIVGDTPSGGHDYVMLDYSECGPKGEPRVVHAAQGCDASEVTLLAPNFKAFVSLRDQPPPGQEE